jgi:hypothetical protein
MLIVERAAPPDLLQQTLTAILDDQELRLHLRRAFTIYHAAPFGAGLQQPLRALLNYMSATVEYWLRRVVPASVGQPRSLDGGRDKDALLDYYGTHRNLMPAEILQFSRFLDDTPEYLDRLNESIQIAFHESAEFEAFVQSVVLHSLSALLKNIIADLGGISSDELVAYADLPVLERVDDTIVPRILIMDTVQGGTGGIAQAFERLDLTDDEDNEASLGWMLQREFGTCPIANGEALVRAVLTAASPQELRAVQAQVTSKEKALERLLENLGLGNPAPEGRQALGRTIFSDIHVGMHAINPALIMQELFALQAALDYGSVVPLTREAVVCQAVAGLDPTRQPETAILRDALLESGVAGGSIARELKLQLLALYDTACPDGCPVCLSAGSDIEHYALAPLLHSRRALRKLREVLRAGSPRNDCLAAVAQSLRAQAAPRLVCPR